MKSTTCEIIILWTPSHIGIIENEQADKIATEALHCGLPIQLPITQGEALSISKLSIKVEWKNEWKQANGISNKVNPDLNHHTDYMGKTRREQVILTRLRLNTSWFQFQHHFTKQPQYFCTNCLVRLTFSHTLECPNTNTSCEVLKKAGDLSSLNSIDVLSSHFPTEHLFTFLKNICLYDII